MKLKAFSLTFFCIFVVAALLLQMGDLVTPSPRQASSQISKVTNPRIVEGYGKLPLAFEANLGQTDTQVQFLSRGQGYTLFLTPEQAVFSLRRPATAQAPRQESHVASQEPRPQPNAADSEPLPAVLRMSLLGANRAAAVSSEEQLSGRVNYILGNDPTMWRTDVPLFGKVRYTQVYPGIDLVYYGNQRQLEFDFVVAPGADPRQIRLHIGGASDRKLDAEGNLVLALDGGEVRFHKPLIYQRVGSEKKEIPGAFRLEPSGEVSFDVGAYDASLPLVIDPVLLYSSFLGGSGQEEALDIAVDSSGAAYITGWTDSTNFPTSASPFRSTNSGGKDVFVTRLNASGTLSYSTYLGGANEDKGHSIAVDGSGNAYVTGRTQSTNFPVWPPVCGVFPFPPCPYQTSNAGFADAFVTKLSSTGLPDYSTYLGGTAADEGNGIAVDSSGNAYVGGSTFATSGGFPTTSGAFQTTTSNACTSIDCVGAGFVTKLNATGTALVYSTYLAGTLVDTVTAIAIDSSGSAYVTGATRSDDFPTTAGVFQPSIAGGQCSGGSVYISCSDAFVTKLNSAGSGLVYSTYLGGNFDDRGEGIALQSTVVTSKIVHHFPHVTGSTFSSNFPTLNAADGSFGGSCSFSTCPDAFVTKLNYQFDSLLWSTFLGGSESEGGRDIAVNNIGDTYVTGYAESNIGSGAGDFPGVYSMQSLGGYSDAFVVRFTPSGAFYYSTYLGGTVQTAPFGAIVEGGFAIAIDGSGNAYVAGKTDSADFPTVSPFQASHAGGVIDAFIAKISPNLTPSANAGPDQVLLETTPGATPFTLSGSGSDPNNDPLTYEWRDAANVIVGSTAVLNLTRPAGVHVFTLFVRDNGGGVGTDTVSITIHRPPVANAGPDQIIEASSNAMGIFTLNGSASSDPDGNAITYAWRDSANNVVGTTAMVVLTRTLGSYTFTLVVTDSLGASSAPDSVTILVQDTTAPTVQVTRPNGGDKLFTGTPYVIEWTATDNGILSFFDVFVSLDGGVSYNPAPVCANVSGTARSCTWVAPGPVNSTARIRVKATDSVGLTALDASNTNFSIVTGAGSVTVTAPNTAVDWGIGSTQKITWNHNLGLTSYVQIEVSRDNGATWSTITASFKNTGATASTYNWLVTGPGSFAALIRVSWANSPSASDTSNARFTISEPYIVVSAPGTTITNFGYGTKRTQTWTTNLGPGDRVNVLMSTDGGATFPVTLASNLVASTKTVTFTAPTLAALTAMARIRVVWTANGTIYGTSPVNFGMQPPFLWLLVPDGPADTWTINSTKTITWAHNLGAAENVKVELSLDGGLTYNIVVLGTTPSDGTQAVFVQAVWATQMGRLRITWLKNSLVTDFSNQDFRIQ